MKNFTRRTFLRSAGIAVALPWLESLKPAWGAPAAEPPRRFVGLMTNQGIMPQFFFPTEAGKNYAATPYLEILKDFRDDMTVFSGVSLPGVDGGHAADMSFLTGAPGVGRGAFKNTVSLDQHAAELLGGDTRFPSLSLMIGNEPFSLSFTRNGSMIPPERDPLKLYQKLFAEDTPQAREAAKKRLKEDRSMLDNLSAQAKSLEGKVNPTDRDRVDQYLTSVRDLEKRLSKAEKWIDVPKPKTAAKAPPAGVIHSDLPALGKMILDLTRLALETDSTRFVTVPWQLASTTPNTIPGVNHNCHELTHHGNRPEKVSELRLIEESIFRTIADFLTGLRGVREQGGTLLSRTIVLMGTNMGSANAHSNDNLPAFLVGGGFKHAGHLAFDRKKNYPLSNVYVSILQRLGVQTDHFSSGTGTMRGLELA
jgi:hypothetical protein